jgi:hypothetical protein
MILINEVVTGIDPSEGMPVTTSLPVGRDRRRAPSPSGGYKALMPELLPVEQRMDFCRGFADPLVHLSGQGAENQSIRQGKS